MIILICVIQIMLSAYVILYGLRVLNDMGCTTRWTQRFTCIVVVSIAFINGLTILSATMQGQFTPLISLLKLLLSISMVFLVHQMTQPCSWENPNADRSKKQTN